MNLNAKYIKTRRGDIIIFPTHKEHSEFHNLDPVSAGFIKFYVDDYGRSKCYCYGKSFSLGLQSEEHDTTIANRQIIGEEY
jgi:hypothetical protein